MTHDLELEKRIICICHSSETTPSHLKPSHFYNTAHQKIYEELKNGNKLLTETDMKGIDSASLFDALQVGAFSELELPSNALKLIGLYNKREKIKEAERALQEAKNAEAEATIEKQDGFDELMDEHNEIAGGTFELLETPWPMLTKDSRFTEGKAITIICGDPGVGKSFFVTHMFGWFAINGTKAILWGAEDNARFHTRRAVAQLVGNSNLCDYEWLKENHALAKRVYEENRENIEKIMGSLYTSNNLSKEDLKKWCWEKAREGYEVIGIDPITFFSDEKSSYKSDQEIMETLNDIRVKHGTRFIIVTHPRESNGAKIGQDAIAGGRAISRFAQNMIWLATNEDHSKGSNRVAYTIKTRNGKREFGGKIKFDFNRDTARWEEV